MIAMLVIILLMIEASFLAGAKEELEDAFNDPNWRNSMKMYIARDEGGLLCFYRFCPWLSDDCHGVWHHVGECFPISTDLFPEVTFENSPQEVELKLIEK